MRAISPRLPATFLCAIILCSLPLSLLAETPLPPEDRGEDTSSEPFQQLLRLLAKRLTLAKEVAAYKFQNGIPIEDREREAIVLKRSLEAAAQKGLSPESVESFFRLQIEFSKHYQQQWFDVWQQQGYPKGYHPPDLAEHIRPQLLRLGTEVVGLLPQLDPVTLSMDEQRRLAKQIFTQPPLTPEQTSRLLHEIGKVSNESLKSKRIRDQTEEASNAER